jgi:K+-sensing histidine kinase KdpD
VAAALLPARDHIGNVNVALVLVVVVIAVAAWGHRLAAFAAAASAAVWFDFFHTRPYYSFNITHRNDAITTALLLVVGVAVGELAVWSRKQQAAAAAGSEDIARIHAVADLVAEGRGMDQVTLAVAYELQHLLSLRTCRFDPSLDDHQPTRIEHDGEIVLDSVRWPVHEWAYRAKRLSFRCSGRVVPLVGMCWRPARACQSPSSSAWLPWLWPTRSLRPWPLRNHRPSGMAAAGPRPSIRRPDPPVCLNPARPPRWSRWGADGAAGELWIP